MPPWLAILLGAWGAVSAVITVVIIPVWRALRGIVTKLERVYQHFDPDAEMAKATGGTLPQRVRILEEGVEHLDDVIEHFHPEARPDPTRHREG